MPFTKLQFKPGVNRETTSYTNEGGWFDCDKVRFRFGFPEKIGGWQRTNSFFLGTCRALHPWIALDSSNYLGVGTNVKYYINEGGGYYDITPIRSTTSAGDVTFVAKANTLNGTVGTEATTITLSSGTSFPSSGVIKVNSEIIFYAALSGNVLSGLTRGYSDTTAASHSSGAAVTCSTLSVTDANHGALQNDFVTLSGAASLGAQIAANVLNQEYQIREIVSSNVYLIDAREVATVADITTEAGYSPTFVFATTSDSGNGGGSVVGAYQINTGLDTTVLGTGWGSGSWSRGTWGSGSSLLTSGNTLRIWSHDNFGEDLLYNARDAGIYYWDKTSGLSARGVALSSLVGANTTPTIAKQILVSDADRHIIAFGCDPQNDIGTQDPLLIRFSSQESLTDWASTATNTAGDLRIGSGSEIITAVETRQQVLVFTDTSLHAMQFLGPPFTFGITTISENITVAGPLSAIAVEDMVFWMGEEEFYVYSGGVQRLPCTVRDYVFSDINSDQLQKVTAGTNTSFSEIWWLYPSETSEECDRYVIYNYQQQVWYYGTLDRTCWLDRGINAYPIVAGPDHTLYTHEFGFDDGSTNPATGISSYIESSQVSLGSGDRFMLVSRLIPDMTFRDSVNESPTALMTVQVRNFPGGNYTNTTGSTVQKTASVPVEQFTEDVFLRLRGRSMAFKIQSSDTGTAWRLGTPRVDMRPDGRR